MWLCIPWNKHQLQYPKREDQKPQTGIEAMINRSKSQDEEDAELTDADILEIEQSIKDIRNGKFKTLKQMKAKYGL